MMMVLLMLLLLADYFKSLLVPVICASLVLVMCIGYSLWLWIRKPRQIVINKWLSEFNRWLTAYFLFAHVLESDNKWCYVIPFACAALVLSVSIISPRRDVVYDI